MKILALFIAIMFETIAFSAIKMPSVFNDGMVLQRDTTVAIWGWAKANETVSITVSWDQTKVITFLSDSKGMWKGELKTPNAGGPYEIKISDGTMLIIKDVLIGEVWLYSGQSNMAGTVSGTYGAIDELKDANYPKIRHFKVGLKTSIIPLEDAPGTWTVCNEQNAANFSAIAFYSARELYKKLKVPIGIINTSYGSSSNQAWLAEEELQDLPAIKNYLDEIKADSAVKLTQKMPTVLYNAMLKPLVPFTIKGVCWYQGEANTDDATDYPALLNKLVDSWRGLWNNVSLPFLIAQLSGFGASGKPDWVKVQLTQYEISRSKSFVATVLTYDKGEKGNIHPVHKNIFGYRFFLAACRLGYHDDIISQGPEAIKAESENGKVILTFRNTGSGFKTVPVSDKINNFYLASSTGTYVAAEARILNGNTVEVTVPIGMQAEYVAYCNKSFNPDVNLYSSVDLPVVPFEGLKIANDVSSVSSTESFLQKVSVIYLSQGNPQLLLKLDALSEVYSNVFDLNGRCLNKLIDCQFIKGEHRFPLSGILAKYQLYILKVVIDSVSQSFLVRI